MALIGVAGCADRNKNGEPDSVASSGEVAKTVDNAGDKVAGAADNMAAGASNMASAAGKAVKGLDDAAVFTPKIKTALGANPALAGSKINVSTNNTSVMLDGMVKSAQQKMVAEQIVKKNAPGYKIVDHLKMGK